MVFNYISKINVWPLPKTGKELISLLGISSYYRAIIPKYEEVEPLLIKYRIVQNRKAELKGQTSSVRGGESMTYANKILVYLFKSGFISVVNGFKMNEVKIREFMNENSNDSGFFDQNKSSNLKGEETKIVLDKNSPEKE